MCIRDSLMIVQKISFRHFFSYRRLIIYEPQGYHKNCFSKIQILYLINNLIPETSKCLMLICVRENEETFKKDRFLLDIFVCLKVTNG